ncbi:MAG: outer membrane lipoprotein-sorting protein, partial [Candidatus Binatia bacterium]
PSARAAPPTEPTVATPAASPAGNAGEIASKADLLLWPDRPSTRDLVFRISNAGLATSVTGSDARTRIGGNKRMLVVLLTPPGVKGMAWLVQPGPAETAQWVYDPNFQHVRKIVPVQGFESFLTSGYTYADLGLVDLGSTYTLLGDEQRDGKRAYKVQATPREPWYYSKIVTWVDADTFAPLAREYYDRTGALWKTEGFGPVQDIGGVPTILERRIDDKQSGVSTTMTASSVRYDAALPGDLFDPAQLPKAASASVWQGAPPSPEPRATP